MTNSVLVSNNTTFQIFRYFTIVVIILCGCIFLPISIYALRKLWLVKDNLIFKKRQSSITICFVIVALINFCLVIGLFIPRVIYDDAFGPAITTHLFAQYCSSFIVIVCIFCWRVYINYYEVNYSKNIVNNEWKSLINSTISRKNEKNWFITHKNTFGNTKYWPKYIILIYILCIIIYYIYILFECDFFTNCNEWPYKTPQKRNHIQAIWNTINIITLAIGTPGIIVLAIIRYKTPKFEDNFFVGTEIKYILINALIAIPLNTVPIILEFIFHDFWIQHILNTFQIFIYSICIFGIILIHTLWPIKRNHHWLLLFRIHKLKTKSSLPLGSSSPRTAVQLKPLEAFTKHSDVVTLSTFRLAQMRDDAEYASGNANEEELGSVNSGSGGVFNSENDFDVMNEMNIILKTEEGFGSFMFHLSTEFSVEILLSLIEFIQYKLYIIENGQNFINIDFGIYEQKYGILWKQKQLISKGVIPESELIISNNFKSREHRKKYDAVFLTYLASLKIDDDELQEKFKLLFECFVTGYHLYCKYVDSNAITEINIRYSTRSLLADIFGDNCNSNSNIAILGFIERRINERLTTSMNNDNMETLILQEINIFYQIFDEAAEEMIKLLKFSFVRFRETSLYKKLVSDTK
eukprot:167064_1